MIKNHTFLKLHYVVILSLVLFTLACNGNSNNEQDNEDVLLEEVELGSIVVRPVPTFTPIPTSTPNPSESTPILPTSSPTPIPTSTPNPSRPILPTSSPTPILPTSTPASVSYTHLTLPTTPYV